MSAAPTFRAFSSRWASDDRCFRVEHSDIPADMTIAEYRRTRPPRRHRRTVRTLLRRRA